MRFAPTSIASTIHPTHHNIPSRRLIQTRRANAIRPYRIPIRWLNPDHIFAPFLVVAVVDLARDFEMEAAVGTPRRRSQE
jgi:hypothetical protein